MLGNATMRKFQQMVANRKIINHIQNDLSHDGPAVNGSCRSILSVLKEDIRHGKGSTAKQQGAQKAEGCEEEAPGHHLRLRPAASQGQNAQPLVGLPTAPADPRSGESGQTPGLNHPGEGVPVTQQISFDQRIIWQGSSPSEHGSPAPSFASRREAAWIP